MNKDVTADLTDEEIQDIIDDAVNDFGVDEDDVQVDVSYEVDGTMNITIPDGVAEEDLEEFIAKELADILGISEDQISVTVDPETGVVDYTISGDSFDDASGIQDAMNDPATIDELNNRLDEQFPGAEITGNDVEDDIEANVDVTVKTDDATNDVDEATDNFTDKQTEDGFEDISSQGTKAFVG